MSNDVAHLIGLSFDPFHYIIERGKIHEFTQAIGDENPVYDDMTIAQKAGLKDITIPPTFPTVFDMWGGPDFLSILERLGLNPLNVLHGEQEYEYLNDIYPNDEITGRMEVIDAKSRTTKNGGLKIVTLQTVYSNQHGETVLVSKSTIVERYEDER